MAPTLGSNWQDKLRLLPMNWDSYQAPRISEEAIKTIESFHTIPCSDGGVQLEIHKNGFDIEITINAKGNIESALICHDKS